MRHNLRSALLIAFIFGLYIYFSWAQGALVLPFTLSMVAGSLLLIQSAWLPIRFIHFFVCLSGFVFLHVLLTFSCGTVFFFEKVKAFILFTYAILFALILLKELLLIPNQVLARFFFNFTIFIGISSLLYIIVPPFQIFNDFLLATIHGHESNSEIAALRDIAQHGGFVRPFPFTTEPSHVAKFVFVTWSAWLYLEEKKRYLLFFIGATLLFLIIRSPIVIPLFGVGIIAILSQGNKQTRFRNFILVSLLLIPFVLGVGYQLLEGRLLNIIAGKDLSTIYRIILPNYFLKAVFLNNPYLGVGVGNVEYIIQLYNDLDSRLMYIEYTPNWYYFTSLVAPILYFGLVGTLIFFSIIYLFFSGKSTGQSVNGLIFFYCVFILANSIGSFYNLLFWAYIAIVYRFSLEKK